MPRSQNATFFGAEPHPDGSRVAGESIARLLSTDLRSAGWSVGEADDWRDAGFFLPIDRDDQSLQLVLTRYHSVNDRWILQIAPRRLPSIVAGWFGATASATADAVLALATDTHHALAKSDFHGFRWCWDDLADTDDCDLEPTTASAA